MAQYYEFYQKLNVFSVLIIQQLHQEKGNLNFRYLENIKQCQPTESEGTWHRLQTINLENE